MFRSVYLSVIFSCLALASSSFAQSLYPQSMTFGSSVIDIKTQLANQCDNLSTYTLSKRGSQAKDARIELVCEGYSYWREKRSLQLEFNDDQLDVIRLSGIRNAAVEIINSLINAYGEPTEATRFLLYFEKGAAAFEPAKDRLSFVSPRSTFEYAVFLNYSRDNPLNLQLSREQWLADLQVLDGRIRNQHINPFWHNSAEGYQDVFYQAQDYIANSIQLDSDLINGYFEKMVAYLADGHSYITNKTARYGSFPYRLEWVGDDLIIVGIDEQYQSLLGAKVMGFNRYTLAQANQMITPFVPMVNISGFKEETKDAYGLSGLLKAAGIIQDKNTLVLNVKTLKGKIVKQKFINEANAKHKTQWVSLFDNNIETLPYYLQARESFQWTLYLEKYQALYVRYAAVAEKNKGDIQGLIAQIDHQLSTLAIKKIIIDVRNNNGGDSFLNAPFVNAIANNPAINQYGKLFVLTNHGTFSAAINFTGNMAIKTHALFVGEPVRDSATFAGEAGPQALYELPNSHIVVSLSFSEWNATYDNDHRDVLVPNVSVTARIEDILQGEDKILQAALNYNIEPLQPVVIDNAQKYLWIGRYDYSADKALTISENQGILKFDISELLASNLYPLSENEFKTDLVGVQLRRLDNGDLELIQPGSAARILKKINSSELKPVELLTAGNFDAAKSAYQKIYAANPNLLSIRGNSLGILATYLRAKYKSPELFNQMRAIAVALHGSPIPSWEDDE